MTDEEKAVIDAARMLHSSYALGCVPHNDAELIELCAAVDALDRTDRLARWEKAGGLAVDALVRLQDFDGAADVRDAFRELLAAYRAEVERGREGGR